MTQQDEQRPDGADAAGAKRTADVTALYTAYRAYIVHEDDLINQRTTWSMTAQGILLAGLGYLYNARLSAMTSPSAIDAAGTAEPLVSGPQSVLLEYKMQQYEALLEAICWFGIAFAAVAFIAIAAALFAIDSTKRQIEKNPDEICKRVLELYPGLTGGGSAGAHWLGLLYPIFSQAILLAFWIVALKRFI